MNKQTLERLPIYLSFLKSLPPDGPANISATGIAEGLGLNDVQVRKDLAQVSGGGRPKLGYIAEELIDDIEQYLGYKDTNDAIIVGVGKLGGALMSYEGFKKYGLNIVAGFDNNEDVIDNKRVFALDKVKDLCARMKIHIAIITVPEREAQSVCDLLVSCGIMAIWSFAPVHLKVPKEILVRQENMASSLAVLSKHLARKINED